MAARCRSARPRSSASPATPMACSPSISASAYGFTWIALVLAVAIAALFALLLGYFMFFGRIAGVFFGIVTLSVTLMLELFMAQTAGPGMAYRRGAAERLQRHERHAAADHPVARRRRSCCSPTSGSITSCSALLVLVYLAPAHPDELVVRQRASSRSGRIRSARRCWATTSASISSSPS